MPRTPKIPENFHRNVFINCPFDEQYTIFFNAIVFTVHDIGLLTRCALEASNAGQSRLTRILGIISECKYSIHDISRTELDTVNSLPRFNMPLELGLDLGCKTFGTAYQKQKTCLIMDVEQYRYQKFISDISGQDVYAHEGDERRVVNIVRDWLRFELDPLVAITPSGDKIFQRYMSFQLTLPSICARFNWNPQQLPFKDFSFAVAAWVRDNPL